MVQISLVHLLGAVMLAASLATSLAHARQLGGAPNVREQARTLTALSRPVTIQLNEQRLQDVMAFLAELTQADIRVFYLSDRDPDGLDPDQPITLDSNNLSALAFIERILDQAAGDFGQPGDNAWQLASDGALQVGTKESLNRYRRLEIYDIKDLLFIQPDFEEAPDFDLNSVLQSQGGGQSPFQDQGNANDLFPDETDEERARPIVDIITDFVETEQWIDNGGDAGTIRYWQGTLLINAPDYMHRQIIGYPWWAGGARTTTNTRGARYVSLNLDAATNQLTDLARDPVVVPAVVGGGATPDNANN
ncbi:MAG: hypothetical protein AAGK04_12320 [Planctomycetota bacterium]